MATKLGKVGMTLGGSWDATRQYDKLTCVLHNGVSWSSRVVVPAGVEPSEANYVYWQKVSERGEQGPEGPRGLIGLTGPRGLQGNSGYTGAADELEVVNNLETPNAIAALSAAQGWELNKKLAQLDQEWSEVKGQIEDAVLEVTVQAQPHIHKVIVTDGGAILEPDKFYDFGEAQQIVIGFAPAEEPHYVAQYAFQFKSPTDTPTILTMPEGVIFPVESDSAFQIKGGLTYQVTIVDNLAVATSWEV